MLKEPQWEEQEQEWPLEEPLYDTLLLLKQHLSQRYHYLKSQHPRVLPSLKQEAETLLDVSGIAGLGGKLFDVRNYRQGIAPYEQFVKAFQTFSSERFHSRPVENQVYFYTYDGPSYRVDTHQGLMARLQVPIRAKDYAQISNEFHPAIWSQLYEQQHIQKASFLTQLLQEWETYWQNQPGSRQPKPAKSTVIDERKNQSWRQFQLYMACLDGEAEGIELAWQIDYLLLYPLAILSLAKLLSAQDGYWLYCEAEFNQPEWIPISLEEADRDNSG